MVLFVCFCFSLLLFFDYIFDEFFDECFETKFLTNLLMNCLTYNILTIASFRIGVPSILFLSNTIFNVALEILLPLCKRV